MGRQSGQARAAGGHQGGPGALRRDRQQPGEKQPGQVFAAGRHESPRPHQHLPAHSQGMVRQETSQHQTFWSVLQHNQLPGSSIGRETDQETVQECRYFQSNYVLVFLVPVLYCLLTSPLLLVVIAASGGAAYIAGLKNSERKLSVAGHEVSLAQQYAVIGLCSIPFFLLAGAGGVVFWVLGASLFFITGHAAFYNYDALDVAEDQEQLMGSIVEEV